MNLGRGTIQPIAGTWPHFAALTTPGSHQSPGPSVFCLAPSPRPQATPSPPQVVPALSLGPKLCSCCSLPGGICGLCCPSPFLLFRLYCRSKSNSEVTLVKLSQILSVRTPVLLSFSPSFAGHGRVCVCVCVCV